MVKVHWRHLPVEEATWETEHDMQEKFTGLFEPSGITDEGVMRFGKKGKLRPRYIGLYRISKRISNVAYELELPSKLAAVHPVFHISMLKKCMGDLSLIIPTENIGIKENLSYEEVPIEILDRQVHKFRTKEVASVKVLWRNQLINEATWEAEENMKKRYPHLFESRNCKSRY
ncbi:hypothetical protein MTR67_031478 [Solanum verrucosum]|uniref:Chromo domain-containing protein n=1 Tax=Solanum verrucosum TaxID=315347 RepID=A0AAF0U2J6_SOLVR|nr:hypothetical protein MTR67_031478 [Solanum verrucosum]